MFDKVYASTIFKQQTMIYRIKESPSICPHCSHHQSLPSNQSLTSSHSSSKNSRKHHIAIPLKKKIVQQNQNIQQTLTLLQEEVEKLKQENQDKQVKIRKLERQLTDFNWGKSEGAYDSSYKESKGRLGNIQNYERMGRMQVQIPEKQFVEFQLDYGRVGKTSRKSTQRHFERSSPHNNSSKMSPKHFQTSLGRHIGEKVFKPTSPTKTLNQIQTRIKEISESKNERIQILTQQLLNSKLIIEQLKQKYDEEVQQNQWLIKFCISFIKMVTEIARVHQHQVTDPKWSIRKNARSSWKYLKEFIKDVLS